MRKTVMVVLLALAAAWCAGQTTAPTGPAEAGKEPAKADKPAAKAKAPKARADTPATEPAQADDPPAGGGLGKVIDDILDSGAIGEMRRGGWFMWPILLLGVLAAGVILERWRSLKMVAADTTVLRGEVMRLLEADQIDQALAKCDAQQGPVPAVLAVGLRKYLLLRKLNHDPAQIEDQVVRSMDDYGVHIVASLERHLPVLATVSSVAPMVGFLGTVQGMVVSFREIVAGMGTANIVALAANGINIALLTTVFGLIVGIPAFMAYNYFTGVINRYVLQVEESATELIETVTLKTAVEKGAVGAAEAAQA